MSNNLSDNYCNLENILDDYDCNSKYINVYKDYINISNKFCNDNINSEYCKNYLNKEITDSNNKIIYIDKINKKQLKKKNAYLLQIFFQENAYLQI